MRRISLLALTLCVFFSTPLLAYEYPTTAKVQYVIECMSKQGVANYGTMYQCSCSIDQIASALPYDDFVAADTYARGKRATGERGGVLREGARANQMRALLSEAEEKSFRKCFPGHAAADGVR